MTHSWQSIRRSSQLIHGIHLSLQIMKNPLWFIIWLVILIFLSFFVAGFCAGWYIIIYPITVCIPGLSVSLLYKKTTFDLSYWLIILAGNHGHPAPRHPVSALLRPRHDGLQVDLLKDPPESNKCSNYLEFNRVLLKV